MIQDIVHNISLKNSDISLRASSSLSRRLNPEPRDGLVTSSRISDLPILTNNNINLLLPLLRLPSDQLSLHLCNNSRDNLMGRIIHTRSSVYLIQLLLDNNLYCLHLLDKVLTSPKLQINQLMMNSLLQLDTSQARNMLNDLNIRMNRRPCMLLMIYSI